MCTTGHIDKLVSRKQCSSCFQCTLFVSLMHKHQSADLPKRFEERFHKQWCVFVLFGVLYITPQIDGEQILFSILNYKTFMQIDKFLEISFETTIHAFSLRIPVYFAKGGTSEPFVNRAKPYIDCLSTNSMRRFKSLITCLGDLMDCFNHIFFSLNFTRISSELVILIVERFRSFSLHTMWQ